MTTKFESSKNLKTWNWEPFEEPMLNSLEEHRYWVEDEFIDAKESQDLLMWAQSIEKTEGLKSAAIGKGALKRTNTEVRSDQIYWLQPSDIESSFVVSQLYNGVTDIAKSKLFLPIKRYECHFTKYEVGSFYKTHRDRHKYNPSRLITCVLYLSDLKEDEGGELYIYPEEKEAVRVQPKAGKIVVFDSELLHEVKVSKAERWSLTGWFRNDVHPIIRSTST